MAERTVLGYAIEHPEWVPIVAHRLDPRGFWDDANRATWEVLLELGSDSTLPRIGKALEARNVPQSKRSASYLHELTTWAIGPSDAERSVDDVMRCARIRAFIDVAGRLAAEASSRAYVPNDDWINSAEARITDALRSHDGQRRSETLRLGEAAKREAEAISNDVKSGRKVQCIKTQFPDLNRVIGGLFPGNLVLVGGRPSMGKSAFAMALAEGAQDGHTYSTHVFSCEMSISALARRAISARSRIDGMKVHQSNICDNEVVDIYEAAAQIFNADDTAPIYLTNSSRWRVGAICSEARRTAANGNLGLIIVDYLQLLRGDKKKYQSDEREIADISGTMKDLAVELNVPVVLLSQLNRELEGRQDKRPKLADLRQSGALEQDADVVMFIFREEVYDSKTDKVGLVDIDVAKNRNGPIGRSTLRWTAQYTRFDNLAWRSDV